MLSSPPPPDPQALQRAPLRHLLVDFNSYFASVEQQEQPALRARPVAVVPVMAESSFCIAASYEAKAFGVKTGTRISQARQLCPGITFLLARPPLYVQYHQRAMQLIDQIAPLERALSIDEAACELTPRWRESERARQLARDVKAHLLKGLGECLKTSVGIGPSIFIAKQASNMQKPDGLTLIESAALPWALERLELGAITGIGRRMLPRLQAAGIADTHALCAAPRDALRAVFGGVIGERFYDALRGAELPLAARDQPLSLSQSHVLPPALRNPAGAFAVLSKLTQKALMRLRKERLLAARMELHLSLPNGAHWHGGQALAPSQATRDFLHALDQIWRTRPGALRTIVKTGIVLTQLRSETARMDDLFTRAEDAERAGRLYRALDTLQERFGSQAAYFASAAEAASEVRMAIAFNHIPDPLLER